MNSNLIMSTKFEDLDTVAKVSNAEFEASTNFDTYFQEMMQNYKYVAGYLYNRADLVKLSKEQRPSFTYNLLLPILMRLAGSFIDNQSKVEALPRTPGDFRMSKVLSDILDYAHYTANNLNKQMLQAFMSATIGRVGWLVQDWRYDYDPQGMMNITVYDPFRIMWQDSFQRRDMKDCGWIIDRGWYTPEEIVGIYATKDDDLREEIFAKASMYLGKDNKRGDRLVNFVERVWGVKANYLGKDQGYDEVTQLIDGMLYNNGQFYDETRGLFKVIEFHDRRVTKVWKLYDAVNNKLWDISKQIGATGDGKKYDNDKLQQLRQLYHNPYIWSETTKKQYVTSVIPSFNMKLMEEAYVIQNGNFKYTPIFCFDFGFESMEWKSYVDHLVDAVKSFNINENMMQTYLMKATLGDVIYEEDALGIHEDAFFENKIGAGKKVAKGGLSKIKYHELPKLPPGQLESNMMKQELLQNMTGIGNNPMGRKESANESARAVNARIMQADLMQLYAQSNAMDQLITIGQNTKDYCEYYMSPGRVIQITRDEENPYWLQINENAITKLFYDPETGDERKEEVVAGNPLKGKYDIVLSKAPFGEAAKQQEFQETMTVAQMFLQMRRPDLIPASEIVKASRIRNKSPWLTLIAQKTGNEDMKLQKELAAAAQQQDLANKQTEIQLTEKQLDVQSKQNEMIVDNFIKDVVTTAIAQ